MRLFSRDRPPADALALLDTGERVASWADTADGAVVMATPLGLWWPFPSGLRRIGWQHVSKATWRDGVMSVVEGEVVDGLVEDRPAVAVTLSTPRDLPIAVRKRVQQNFLKNELVSVSGGAVRFVQRRVPGADRSEWSARPEPGTRLTPETRAAVQARLELLRGAG
jgi:hypothetical protein